MSVWYAIPSKRSAEDVEQVLSKWRVRGYKIALYLDADAGRREADISSYISEYPGYAVAVNRLVWTILHDDPKAEWIVTGGDDVEPDPNHTAKEIAAQCSEYFDRIWWERVDDLTVEGSMSIRSQVVAFRRDGHAKTWGVMQPTGDRWGEGDPGPWPKDSAYIDRVCGSPWMGRAFCERINQGRGPLREEFRHMYVDEALQCIAEKYGVLWQRRDLTHYHRHWARKPGTDASACPEFLKEVNGPKHWKESKAIFDRLNAEGWPGSEPL